MLEHGGDIYRNEVNIDFSVNTSPYGIPELVREAMTASLLHVSEYPDSIYEELREQIARLEGVNSSAVVCGNGASELISAVLHVITKHTSNDTAGILVPSFLGYAKAMRLVGIKQVNKVLLCADNDFLPKDEDVDKLFDKASFVILGNPNNPTGRKLPHKWLERVFHKAIETSTYVIIDESFLPLCPLDANCNCCASTIHSKKIICIKSFTKSMAIPGVRIGYAIVEDENIRQLLQEALPDWNVSIPAMYAGIAATKCTNWLYENVNSSASGIEVLKDYLKRELSLLGIKVFDSDTNFILIKMPNQNIDLYTQLLKKGILIRSCDNYDGLDSSYYRIAVKGKSDNEQLVKMIREIICPNANIGVECDESLSGGKLQSVRATEQLMHVLPADIEKTSFSILTDELNRMGINLVGDTAPIIKRCIHTTADFEYAYSLEFSKDAVAIAKNLIRNGAHIVTDTNMALSGINKKELSKYGGEVHCFMADENIASLAKRMGTTRATASMRHAASLNEKIIFAVGNAPTALVALCEMIDSGIFVPDFVIGVPVGFVNVVSAKEMIVSRDIPYIVNRGRKGGSNVAAAICNAILYSMREDS